MNNTQKVFNVLVVLALIVAFAGLAFPQPTEPVIGGGGDGIGAQGLSVMRIGNPVVMNQSLEVKGAGKVGGNLDVVGTISAAAVVSSTNPTYTNITTTENIVDGGTLTVAGATALNGGITVDTTNFTVDGTTGAVSSAAGVTALTAAIGGGYASTGCDVSAAGNLACAGTLDIDGATAITGTLSSGALTAASASIGGGYSSTGCDLLATGVLNCAGAANIGGAVNISGTISKSGVSFTGVMKWGASSVYTSGASITHGFSVTPTVCILQPARDVTSTLTITATGFSSDMATVSTPVYWMCGQ